MPSVPCLTSALITLLQLVYLLLVINVADGLAQGLSPDLKPQQHNAAPLDRARRLSYHTRFLRQVAKSSPQVEVVWNMDKVLPSLRFIAQYGSERDNDAAKAVGSIFTRTENNRARELCLLALMRIGGNVARREMLRIYNAPAVPAEWRSICADYLGMPSPEGSKADSTSASSP